MTGAVFTLFYALFLFDAPRKLFRDSDTGWHIRSGETIIQTGKLPRTDPYSWSRQGSEWLAWEWSADVILGIAHIRGGLPGVTLLYLALLSICSWLWFRLTWAAGGDFLLSCVLASPMLSTVNLHWLARPHIFGWLLLLAWVWCAERPPIRSRWWHAVAAFLAGSAWANLHASFFLLPATAVLYAIGYWLRPLLWTVEPDADFRAARWFAVVATTAAAGSFLNPYGWLLHQHVFSYLTNRELLERIGEFQSFNFHNPGSIQILLALAIAGIGAVFALDQGRLGRFFLLGGMCLLALRSARGLPLVALLLPLANGSITEGLRKMELRPWIRGKVDGFLAYGRNLRALDSPFRGYAWAPLMLLAAGWILWQPSLHARTGFPPEEFPVLAASAVEGLPGSARLFAPDKFGGYLIYRFQGERKVYFDGRSDFYGVRFMKRYIDFVQVRPGWDGMIETEGFTHALVPVNYSLAAVLPLIGWTERYRDSTAVLLERPTR